MRPVYILFLLAVVFVLTYNPKTGTIEKIMTTPQPPSPEMRRNVHYQDVQFVGQKEVAPNTQ